MIFNQFAFLFLFLPAVTTAFFLMPQPLRRYRPHLLFAASLVFYGLSGIEHAIVLVADIILVWALARHPGFPGNRKFLWAAVVPPVLALFYYKYLGFFIADVLGLGLEDGMETFSLFDQIILPAGISFFTFQVVSFAVDRYRGQVPEMPSLGRFALYISFFPQLVAGPILRFSQVADPLSKLRGFRLDSDRASRAVGYVVTGLTLKVLFADTLSYHAAAFVAAPGSLPAISAVYTMVAYSFQIYFDFYGYSLVAIGLGCLFGFDFPDNFRYPYASANPREFWRRWHITLSYWIRDYLYLPLGGNRTYVRNILIIFAVCGLWHGAGWSFVIWGLYHGFLVVAYHGLRPLWDRLPRLVSTGLTFSLVTLGWTLFLFDFDSLRLFAGSVIGQADTVTQAQPSMEMWGFLALASLVCFGYKAEHTANNLPGGTVAIVRNAGFGVVFFLVLLFLDRTQTFIYFRF